MRQVAFLRNVNQGERGQPSTADLLAAFADAGCADAVAFQSNGTIVFHSPDPEAVISDAVLALAARSGHERDGFGMPLPVLARVVERHASQTDVGRRELTLHSGGILDLDDPGVIGEATLRRCRIVDSGDGWVVSVNERDRESNATPVLERITNLPATSRGMPTLTRLVDRFGQPEQPPRG